MVYCTSPECSQRARIRVPTRGHSVRRSVFQFFSVRTSVALQL